MVVGVKKGEDRSLSADYEDFDADYDDEDFEGIEDEDELTENNRDNDFWENIMGTEEDKRTQCSETTGWNTKKVSGTNVKCKFTFKYTEAGISSSSATCKGVNSGTKKALAFL